MRPRWILKGLGMLILAALLITAYAWVTMSLWNWLVPVLFKGPVVTFLQAAGLLFLARLLLDFRGGPRGYIHGRMRDKWRAKMEAKWASLSPEEQAKKREAFRRHCGNRRWEEPYCPEPGSTEGSK